MQRERPERRNECAAHSGHDYALVCQHLDVGRDLGVVSASESAEAPHQSWCCSCDALLLSRGMNWDPETEAAAAPLAVCLECYEVICRRNRRQDLGSVRLFGILLAALVTTAVLVTIFVLLVR